MPYTFNNWDYVAQLAVAKWARIAAVNELCQKLKTVDYSVVDSRREGHAALNSFHQAMLDGTAVFSETTRFPRSFADTFITTADSEVTSLLVALSTNLSYRASNTAKDTDAATSKGKEKEVEIGRDQSLQDNTKRFEELCKKLCNLPNVRTNVWSQGSFETRTASTWAATPAATT